jgi:hypothetical protein
LYIVLLFAEVAMQTSMNLINLLCCLCSIVLMLIYCVGNIFICILHYNLLLIGVF